MIEINGYKPYWNVFKIFLSSRALHQTSVNGPELVKLVILQTYYEV